MIDPAGDTQRFYETHADEYAATTEGIDTRPWVTRFATYLSPGARVLDVGSGSGRDLRLFKEAGLQPCGLDRSERLAAIAREHAGVPVVVGDLRAPPFPPAFFEGLWAMASLLHLDRAEVVAALQGLRALLVAGGVLYTSVKPGFDRVRGQDGRWFTLYQADEWVVYLKEAAFDLVEMFEQPNEMGANGVVGLGWISCLTRAR